MTGQPSGKCSWISPSAPRSAWQSRQASTKSPFHCHLHAQLDVMHRDNQSSNIWLCVRTTASQKHKNVEIRVDAKHFEETKAATMVQWSQQDPSHCHVEALWTYPPLKKPDHKVHRRVSSASIAPVHIGWIYSFSEGFLLLPHQRPCDPKSEMN